MHGQKNIKLCLEYVTPSSGCVQPHKNLPLNISLYLLHHHTHITEIKGQTEVCPPPNVSEIKLSASERCMTFCYVRRLVYIHFYGRNEWNE